MKALRLSFFCLFLASCTTVSSISGYYVENGENKYADFVELVPKKIIDLEKGLSQEALYGKVGETKPGNFYWQKVNEPRDNLPARFKINKLWPIE